MNIIFRICFTFLLVISFYNGKSQGKASGFTVKMNGYIINVGGKILFQPCEDNAKDVWHSLDNRSFPLWYFREDLYLDAIDNVGDSVKIYCYDIDDKKNYYMNFSYFYCSLEIDMMLLDSTSFKVYKESKYQITFNNKIYYAYGFNINNRIKKIIPEDKKNLLLMYQYYKSKGYIAPKWIDELLRNKKKK